MFEIEPVAAMIAAPNGTPVQATIMVIEPMTRMNAVNMIQTAFYVLQETSSNVVVDRGTVQSTTSYNIVDSDFGTIMAERDARTRGVDQLAESITLRVALYFNRRETLTKRAPAQPAPRVIEKK